MAIVQEVVRTKNVEEYISICKDKSIFKEEDIQAVYSKYPTVLDYGIKAAPQSFVYI